MLFTGTFSVWTIVALVVLAGLLYLLLRKNKYEGTRLNESAVEAAMK